MLAHLTAPSRLAALVYVAAMAYVRQHLTSRGDLTDVAHDVMMTSWNCHRTSKGCAESSAR